MKVLIVSPYSYSEPRHGGQLRAAAFHEFYKNLGCEVQSVGVRTYNVYSEQEGFLPSPGAAVETVFKGPPDMYVYGVGQLFYKNNEYYERLKKNIQIEPDIIHVVQPWLFQFVKRYCSELKITPLIIYDSQNIEYQLKSNILQLKGDKNYQLSSDLIKTLEKFIWENADLILPCSLSDQDMIQRHTEVKTILVENGINDWSRKPVMNLPCDEFCLFVASAHLPNKEGFFYYLSSPAFGCLNPDQRLVVVGSVSDLIKRDGRYWQTPGLKERVILMGQVDEQVLTALKNTAKAIILPIRTGGGTNLKTAEALVSGKHVVASDKSMRGYEEFANSSGVWVCKTPSEFKLCIRKVMGLPAPTISEDERRLRSKLLWSNKFEALKNYLIGVCDEK